MSPKVSKRHSFWNEFEWTDESVSSDRETARNRALRQAGDR